MKIINGEGTVIIDSDLDPNKARVTMTGEFPVRITVEALLNYNGLGEIVTIQVAEAEVGTRELVENHLKELIKADKLNIAKQVLTQALVNGLPKES